MFAALLVALVLSSMTAGGESGLGVIDSVKLVDQYGVEDHLANHRGKVAVVMVVTAKRLRNIRPWERYLREHFDDRIFYLRITDVPADSIATVRQISEKLTASVPDGVSVLIDIDRIWATALDLDTARPNILVIDGDGSLVASHRGRYEPELAAQVVEDLHQVVHP